MNREQIEALADEGSINTVNGYTFFISKEDFRCVRVSPHGEIEIMPRLKEPDIKLKDVVKVGSHFYHSNTEEET